MRNTVFTSGEIYHIFNRGVDKRPIFLKGSFYERFVGILRHYLVYDYRYSLFVQMRRREDDFASLARKMEKYRWEESPVEVLSFCLMPNHFHLQVRQLAEGGVTSFMHRIGTSYTNYFNIRLDRAGRLFQGPFKAVRVVDEGQLLCLNRYIHVNPTAADLVDPKHLVCWQWSSLPEYLGKRKGGFCNKKMILSYFKDANDYLDFISADFEEVERQGLENIAIDDDFGWFGETRERKKKLQQDAMSAL